MVVALEDLHWADASTLDLLAFLAHGVGRASCSSAPTARKRSASASRCSDSCPRRSALAPRCLWSSSRSGATTSKRSSARAARHGRRKHSSTRSLPAPRGIRSSRRSCSRPSPRRRGASARPAGHAAGGRRPPGHEQSRGPPCGGRGASGRTLRTARGGVTVGRACARRGAAAGGRARPVRAGPAANVPFPPRAVREAVYDTLLPGEREVLHERIARALTEEPRLAMSGGASAESAQHWAAARRPQEALAASLEAAKEAEQICGLTEALGHLERVLASGTRCRTPRGWRVSRCRPSSPGAQSWPASRPRATRWTYGAWSPRSTSTTGSTWGRSRRASASPPPPRRSGSPRSSTPASSSTWTMASELRRSP